MCWTHDTVQADAGVMTTTTTPTPSAPSPTHSRVSTTVLTALAPAVWGTTYLVTTEFLPAVHPLFAALMRALPAGLIARRLPAGSWWWRAVVLGTLNIGIFFPLLFVAAARLPGGVAATLGAAQPILVTVLAVIVLGERLSVWRLGWGFVGGAGVGLVVLGPGAGFDPVGIAAGILGAASMGTGVILVKKWGLPPGVLTVRAAPGQTTQFLSLTEAVLSAIAHAQVPLPIIGGAGPLQSPNDPESFVLDEPEFVAEEWRELAASVAQLDVCRNQGGDHWTYLSPPAVLEPGNRLGEYQRGTTALLIGADGQARISAEDLAAAVIDEIESPEGDRHFTVARV